ncbi:MAG: lasso peptide biosynthesis B2 protein [Cyanobacteria bacterium P01_F01_bin.86]
MQRILKLLSKLRRSQKRDLGLLAIAFGLLSIVRLGLWLMPFRTLCNVLMRIRRPSFSSPTANRDCGDNPSSPSTAGEASDQRTPTDRNVAKLVWSIQVAGRYLPGRAKCLARALATQVLMNWYRYSSELRIGVDKTPAGEFRAHAWIEYQGRVIIGNLKDLSQFTPLIAYRGLEL